MKGHFPFWFQIQPLKYLVRILENWLDLQFLVSGANFQARGGPKQRVQAVMRCHGAWVEHQTVTSLRVRSHKNGHAEGRILKRNQIKAQWLVQTCHPLEFTEKNTVFITKKTNKTLASHFNSVTRWPIWISVQILSLSQYCCESFKWGLFGEWFVNSEVRFKKKFFCLFLLSS